MKNFKEELLNDFIPAIRRMVAKEAKHLNMLKSFKKKYSNKTYFYYFSDKIKTGDETSLDEMIEYSQIVLNHLKGRLNEYVEYVKTVKDEVN